MAIQEKFEQGIPHAKFFVYGYRWEGDNLVTEPYEAKVVQEIFEDYLSGKTRKDIVRELKAEGIRTMYGNPFKDASIRQILTNRVYTGLLEIQKTFVVDPINKRQIYNHGEKDKYIVEHHHEAIIEPDVFEQVQAEMARRKQDGLQRGGYARRFLNTCCFTGIIKCGICGKSYTHVIRRYKGKANKYWTCESHKGKGTNCGARGSIPEQALKKACASVLGTEAFEEKEFLQKVAKIVVPAYKKLTFYMTDGRIIEKNWESTALKDCWTDELKKKQRNWIARYRQSGGDGRYTAFSGRIRCPRCGVTFIRIQDKRKNVTVPYWRVRSKHKCVHRTGIKEDTLKKAAASLLGIPKFDEEVFKAKIKCIEIQEDGSLLFRFLDGHVEGVDLP
jgi:site-specific DNA recombinase